MYGNDLCVVPYFASSNSYMVPYMEVTCASSCIPQVPIHTCWCHVWKLHVRPSVFHKSHITYGTIDGTMYGTTPRYNNHIWHEVSHIWHHITHICTPYMTFLQGHFEALQKKWAASTVDCTIQLVCQIGRQPDTRPCRAGCLKRNFRRNPNHAVQNSYFWRFSIRPM